MTARDDLIRYAASTRRTVTADGLAPYLNRVEREVMMKAEAAFRTRIVRRIFAMRMPETPHGWSERYIAGWNEALGAAEDEIRKED